MNIEIVIYQFEHIVKKTVSVLYPIDGRLIKIAAGNRFEFAFDDVFLLFSIVVLFISNSHLHIK